METNKSRLRNHVALLIRHWLKEGLDGGEKLELAKCHLDECLHNCQGETSSILRQRVRGATSLRQIEALRVAAFNQISRQHHQQRAIEAIRLLDELVKPSTQETGRGDHPEHSFRPDAVP